MAPSPSIPTRVLMALVRAYQLVLSPWLQTGCRYEPTCSHYAEQAVRRHGVVRGLGLATWRLLRCNPWSKGGYDPVPGDDREVTA